MLPMDARVATPVSHLFEDRELAREATALSDALELRDHALDPPATGELLYHSEANAAAEWSAGELDRLAERHRSHGPDLVSLHLDSRYDKVAIEDGRYIGVGQPSDRATLLANVEANVEAVRDVFGDVPVLLENNNHLGTDVYDTVTEPSFLEAAVDRSGAWLLFDLAHAAITAENTGADFEEYVRGLPLDRCRQVHLSRLGHGPNGAVDAHAFLRWEDWRTYAGLRADLSALEYVTLEYYRDPAVLLDQLERMQTGESERIVVREPWDSDFFGLHVASVASEPTPAERLDYALVRCRERDIDCLYFETVDPHERDEAMAREFELVDTRVVFARTALASDAVEAPAGVRPHRAADRSALVDIAGAVFEGTRFFNDDHFEDRTCDELYATWIENACAGYADEVLVAIEGGEPVGFVTCDVEEDRGSIGLIAVATDAQGSGVGTRLVEGALHWFHERGATAISVETQASNDHASKLYRATGFEATETRFVLHRWFEGRPEPGGSAGADAQSESKKE